MRHFANITRRIASTSLPILTLTLLFGAATTAHAQLRAFVDCVEKVDNSNYRAYFGYVSLYSGNITYQAPGPDNYFVPVPNPPGQPTVFKPGIHHRVVSVVVPNNMVETWVLEESFAGSTAQTLFPCADPGGNTRTITYQGRLTDTNAAANGQYDLSFQLFNAVTNGTSQSATLELDSVSVANGIFTAQLDFGIPVFLDGGNLFVEIGVRPGAATGGTAYTTLAPRRPLTAAPYAIRAQSAANADLLGGYRAEDFMRHGSQLQGAINGTATNATNVSGGFVQLPLTTGAPSATECDKASEYGRQKVDSANLRLYICTVVGWKFTSLQ